MENRYTQCVEERLTKRVYNKYIYLEIQNNFSLFYPFNITSIRSEKIFHFFILSQQLFF